MRMRVCVCVSECGEVRLIDAHTSRRISHTYRHARTRIPPGEGFASNELLFSIFKSGGFHLYYIIIYTVYIYVCRVGTYVERDLYRTRALRTYIYMCTVPVYAPLCMTSVRP